MKPQYFAYRLAPRCTLDELAAIAAHRSVEIGKRVEDMEIDIDAGGAFMVQPGASVEHAAAMIRKRARHHIQ